jgi:bile acid-coenzyme A ligase
VGQIWFRAKDGSSSYRYLGREADDGGGWGSFGDLGHVDDDGYLFIADRRTDLIVSGGANVYPAEVEAAIESHPAVRSSAVIALPDDDLGHRVHAIVDVGGHDDLDLDPEQLIAALRAHLVAQLAPYKRPRTFEIVRDSLRDEAGKVRRFALRAARIEPST